MLELESFALYPAGLGSCWRCHFDFISGSDLLLVFLQQLFFFPRSLVIQFGLLQHFVALSVAERLFRPESVLLKVLEVFVQHAVLTP